MATALASNDPADGREPQRSLIPEIHVTGSVAVVSFFIEGHPVAKARPRFGRDQHGRPKTFTPQETKDWESEVGWQARGAVNKLSGTSGAHVRFPFEHRVMSELTFYMHRPKSYPKTLTVMTKKPDLDNLSKAVLDGLSKAHIIKDDNQVTDELNRKRYAQAEGMPTGVHVTLTGWLG